MPGFFERVVPASLRLLARAVIRYPRLFFYPQVILFTFSILYTIEQLQFSTSRNDLVGADKLYHRNYLKYKAEFEGQDDLVAVVESEDMEKNRQFVERLGVRLEAETNLFSDVFYKGDLKMLGPKALLFLDPQNLDELHSTLRDFTPFIQGFSKATNMVSLIALINQRFRTAKPEQNEENEGLIKALPAVQRIIDQAADSLRRPGAPPSPGLNALFGAGPEAERQMYITFADGRLYLVTARARSESQAAEAVERLRALVRLTQDEVPGVNVGVTGEPVLELDEMAQSQTDTTAATVVSLALVWLIFVYGYKETGRPLKAMACLVVGLGYTMAYTTLTVGHLNILTITFVPILIGLAIDFGVHLITRYEEELRHGRTQNESMEIAMVNTGQGIFTGCLTTSAAFFAMGLTDFRGIQEMGIISGGGLIICLVPMLTLLPVLLLRGRQNQIDHDTPPGEDRRARLERMWLNRPVAVVVATGILIGASLIRFNSVYFDYNLLNMQSAGLPAVIFEKKLVESANKSVLYGAVITGNIEEALRLEEALKKLPTVESVESVARYLHEDPTPRLTKIREIKQLISSIQFAEPDLAPADLTELRQRLTFFQGYLGLACESAQKEKEETIYKMLSDLRNSVARFQYQLLAMDPAQARIKLASFQQALFRDVRQTFNAIQHQDDSGGLRAQDLPPALRNRFIGKTGKYLLQAYPKEDVWQRDKQEAFVKELRTLDPNVTGTPVQLLEYTSLLKTSYEQAALYALGAIAIMVWIHFHSLGAVLLSLIPVAIGTLWMVGAMGWADIPFNPANIMTLPLVIGVGVTNGIHILNRYNEEKNPSILARSTGKAVLVSALTTIVGFGSLMLAKHQGISSLGFIMAVGTTTCMIASLTFLPVLLGWLSKKQAK